MSDVESDIREIKTMLAELMDYLGCGKARPADREELLQRAQRSAEKFLKKQAEKKALLPSDTFISKGANRP
jgi:hypothetical protein